MRKLFCITFLLISVAASAQRIGVLFPLSPNNLQDNSVNAFQRYINGGWHSGATLASRDSLPVGFSKRLYDGMMYFVRSNGTVYQWNSSTNNWDAYFNQALLTTSAPTFAGLTSNGYVNIGYNSLTGLPQFQFRVNGLYDSQFVLGMATTNNTPFTMIGFRMGGADNGQNGAPSGLFPYRIESRDYGARITMAGVNANNGSLINHWGFYGPDGTTMFLRINNTGTIQMASPAAGDNTEDVLTLASDGTIHRTGRVNVGSTYMAPTYTPTQVLFAGSDGKPTGSASFQWDNTNGSLTLNTLRTTNHAYPLALSGSTGAGGSAGVTIEMRNNGAGTYKNAISMGQGSFGDQTNITYETGIDINGAAILDYYVANNKLGVVPFYIDAFGHIGFPMTGRASLSTYAAVFNLPAGTSAYPQLYFPVSPSPSSIVNNSAWWDGSRLNFINNAGIRKQVPWLDEVPTNVQFTVTGNNILTATPKQSITVNASSQAALVLPGAPSDGDEIYVFGYGAGGWRITPQSGQQIRGFYSSSTGITGVQNSAIFIKYNSSLAIWQILSHEGTLTAL